MGKIPRSRIALETGTHSPWVSRLLTVLGHEVIILTIRWRSSRTIRFEGRAQAFEASYRSP